MWFECLPSIAIVAAALHIAPIGSLIVNYLLLNKHVSGWPIAVRNRSNHRYRWIAQIVT